MKAILLILCLSWHDKTHWDRRHFIKENLDNRLVAAVCIIPSPYQLVFCVNKGLADITIKSTYLQVGNNRYSFTRLEVSVVNDFCN